MFQNKYYLTLILAAFIISSCSTQQPVEENAEEKTENRIFMNTEQIKNARLQYGKAEIRPVSGHVRARGKIILPPENEVQISGLFPGRLIRLKSIPGQMVKQGDVLAFIQNPEIIEMQKLFAQNYFKRKNLAIEIAAKEQLSEQKMIAKTELESLRNQFAALNIICEAEAEQLLSLNIDTAELLVGKIKDAYPLIAHIGGKLHINENIQSGEFIESGEEVFEILNTKEVLIELMVFEKDIHLIRLGQQVSFKPGSSEESQLMDGTIETIGAQVNEQDRTVKVIVKSSNPENILLPGMFVSANIHYDLKNQLSLDESAFVYFNGRETVFYTLPEWKEQDGSWFQSLKIKKGDTEGKYSAFDFLEKPPQNAIFVVDGAYFIKSSYLLNEE